MAEILGWRVEGDWFDVCKCNIPCPCYFAQPPSYGDCDGVLAWHVRKGKYGKVSLDDLNVLALSTFVGNVWAGAKATIGIFIDQRASEAQREALQMIFGGRAGGWPSEFAKVIGEVRGIEYASISFEVASDLAFWRAEIPGKVMASADALTGPTTRPGDRVQVHNPPGSEVGPGTVATQGVSTANQAEAFGFRWEWSGRSSKHMQFTWSGP
jgi:hypothetical protein